jgi:hypothetical protein
MPLVPNVKVTVGLETISARFEPPVHTKHIWNLLPTDYSTLGIEGLGQVISKITINARPNTGGFRAPFNHEAAAKAMYDSAAKAGYIARELAEEQFEQSQRQSV